MEGVGGRWRGRGRGIRQRKSRNNFQILYLPPLLYAVNGEGKGLSLS
jgi:hypothetical protein